MGSVRNLIYVILLLLAVQGVQAQDFVMNDSTIYNCGGTFFDDGYYLAYTNKDYTFTICPDAANAGNVVWVDFNGFRLTQGLTDATSDWLYVYDGANASAPLIGKYTGDQLQGITISGSINNASGCLTFRMDVQSGNADKRQGWRAPFRCALPCDYPSAAAIITAPNPALGGKQGAACFDVPFSFDASASTPGAGKTIAQYKWDFGDGQTDLGANVNPAHTYAQPYTYDVTLTVVDNQGCESRNTIRLEAIASTYPEFRRMQDLQLCLGGEMDVPGIVGSDNWTIVPVETIKTLLALEDGNGFSYKQPLEVDYFEPGAVLEDCNDLLKVFMNVEHSYAGDLEIELECPDGTTVNLIKFPMLYNYEAWLGEPIDDGNPTPGIGWDYYWSPSATIGTWDDARFTERSLPSDIYESDEDLCALVGCPLNGTWNLKVSDYRDTDNGYLFEWGLFFNPDLWAESLNYFPSIGRDVDSSYWDLTGPFITSSSADGNIIHIAPPALGSYDYQYSAINNYHCANDTTITVEVVNGPQVDAGMDLNVCVDGQLMAEIASNDFSFTSCLYRLEFKGASASSSDFQGRVGVTRDAVLLEYVFARDSPYDFYLGIDETLEFTWAPYFGPGLQDELILKDETGNVIWQSGTGLVEGVVYSNGSLCTDSERLLWNWTPADRVSATDIPNPIALNITAPTTFTVEVYPQGFPGCLSTDMVEVSTLFDFLVEGESPKCPTNEGWISTNIDPTSNAGPWTVELYLNDQLIDSRSSNGGVTTFSDLYAGNYYLSMLADSCSYGQEMVLQYLSDPKADFVASPSATTLPNTSFRFFEEAVGDVRFYDWDFAGLGNSDEANPSFKFPADVRGAYDVQLLITDKNGCQDTVIKTVRVNDALTLFIPNAFTPDNDGYNDVFYVQGRDIDPDRFLLQIFSRWGQLVFESEDVNEFWNGTFMDSGSMAPEGLYVWRVVTNSESTGDTQEFKGHVFLLP